MESIRKATHKLIMAREKTEVELKEDSSENNYLDFTTEGLFTRDAKIKCIFCEKNHWSDECQRYKTLEDRKAKIKGKCYNCFRNDHFVRRCESEKSCFYCKAKKNHHSSLCPEKFGTLENEEACLGSDYPRGDHHEVLMKTAKVEIMNPLSGKRDVATVLLDTGAKHSYITTEKAKSIGLQGGKSTLVKLNTFGTKKQSTMHTQLTSLLMLQKDGRYMKINARICSTVTGTITRKQVSMKKYGGICKDLIMADELPDHDRNETIDILIGNDYYEEIVKAEKIQVDQSLYLVNSSLGWMFSGKTGLCDSDEETVMLVEEESNEVHKLWELEIVGISEDTKKSEDFDAIKQFNDKVVMEENRYKVPWLWRTSKYELADNLKLAKSRLKSLVTRESIDTLKKYDEMIKQQMKNGIIELADSSDEYLKKEEVITHYLPHHLVKSVDGENTKLRIVYEGCAKTHPSKKSINECLLRGPNLVADLCGVWLRFRTHPIAMVADIEKAYVQMALYESDRDVTRFLWLKEVDGKYSEENIVHLRFCRVIWGIVSAAFLLAMTISYHLAKYNNDVSKQINEGIYVDNLITGVSSVNEAKLFYSETKRIFNEASMNMRKWSSNSDEVMNGIDDVDRCNDDTIKLLRMIWFRKTDEIGLVKIPNYDYEQLTKRNVLKYISKIFDPLNLMSPATLKAKLFLQDLWREKIPWDEEIVGEKSVEWNRLTKHLSVINSIKLRRCVGTEKKPVTNTLITFTDASQVAYTACVYLKIDDGSSNHVDLVFTKTRLAPLNQKLSIPRLELLGVLIGCRISNFVKNKIGIKIDFERLFTDSKCAMEWCKTANELKRFVRDRVDEIRGYNANIGYICSADNPADISSRGQNAEKLRQNELWWNGPRWIKLPENQWPNVTYDINDEYLRDTIDKEINSNSRRLFEINMISSSEELKGPFDIDEHSFSSYWKLIRVTAWCYRFVENARGQVVKTGLLDSTDIQKSGNSWLKVIQKRHFADVFSDIDQTKKNQLQLQLGLYEDDNGILRCAGRLVHMPIHPKLLPKKSHFTDLCITKYHQRMLHSGVAQTLAALRNEFWVINGRSATKKVIKACLTCIHWEGGPFKTPSFAPLPEYVLSCQNPPFTFTGLDYLGPLLIKDGIQLTKNWVCLLTCLNVRAIHLELVDDMSTKEFILCLRRFIARRGTPKLIISDNASQFKTGHSVIDQIWKSTVKSVDVQSYAASHNIKWKFTTEHTPWKGGFYERLVGLTKRALRKSLGVTKVTRTELLTLLTEIEATLNSRPLTHLSTDIDSGFPLTPGHFLSINNKTGTPDADVSFQPSHDTSYNILKMWKTGQSHLNRYWKVWLTEYLPSLRERQNVQMKAVKGELSRHPIKGEIVIVREEGLSRGKWKLGKIVDLIKSEVDGVVRAVTLKYPSGRIIKRPFRDVFPLECKDVELDSDEEDAESVNIIKVTKGTKRPNRKAAHIAKTKIQQHYNSDDEYHQ